jgi:hypothetical protein
LARNDPGAEWTIWVYRSVAMGRNLLQSKKGGYYGSHA